ncbi:MAG: CRISPR-associated helicase Cas3' [Acidaminococcales bacterium]|jgi:CRISPR-associated endonuclease/helicase Cas3|nr:CRISPR-associated helicase Cas3' [Acidaminococcales bacterium]
MLLSQQAKALWAKAAKSGGGWLPLYKHMEDAAIVAELLWDNWLPPGTKDIVARAIADGSACFALEDARAKARKTFIFLAAAHDLGKATPAFQYKKIYPNAEIGEQLAERLKRAGLIAKRMQDPYAIHHSLASQAILERRGFTRAIAVVLGGHHGKPPSIYDIDDDNINAYPNNTGFKDKAAWGAAQSELFNYACQLADMPVDEEELLRTLALDIPAQVILSGLVIMADWLASDENRFPYLDGNDFNLKIPVRKRAADAWENIGLSRWAATEEWAKADLYKTRFDKEARPVQKAAVAVAAATKAPGLFIVEAPMGEGKTEAALAVAEIFAQKSGRGGLFFALPTQATSDGIFVRFKNWADKIAKVAGGIYSLSLAHGKARLNEEYRGLKAHPQGIEDAEGGVVAQAWFSGRKKSLLADFVVGTVDQALMAGLRQKHQAMRHLSLANKVVIIDECHAYDAYMSQYLYKALNWLGAYRVPVILLSATLPVGKRQDLINAYKGGQAENGANLSLAFMRGYPIITSTDGGEAGQTVVAPSERGIDVSLSWLYEDADIETADEGELPIIEKIADILDEYLSGGGCVGIIVNTVRRAQKIAQGLAARYGTENVRLLHSRFIGADRVANEMKIRELLGAPTKENTVKRPEKLIVVGTQVMEQSLDVDFDLLFTDICPMDLLLQRIGRLHRHERPRPEKLRKAVCFITGAQKEGFEAGAEKIYGKYLLFNTQQLLLSKLVLNLPADIPGLVDAAYDPDGVDVAPDLQAEYAEAKHRQENKIKEKTNRADQFQIFKPGKGENLGTLIDWLDIGVNDPTGKRAEATVRDTDNSLEVIVLQKRRSKVYLLPWLDKSGGREISRERSPDEDIAAKLAACTVNLPGNFSSPKVIDAAIGELEQNNIDEGLSAWQQSPWLKGELFLLLDENLSARLGGYTLKYDEKYGLWVEKAGEE